MVSKSFHLGDLLSVTTERLVSPDHMNGVYRVVDFVTGVEHLTHQLPRAVRVVAPWLLEQHPWLSDIPVPDGLNGKDAVVSWLALVAAKFGEFHEVAPMPFGMYVGREPIAELRELAPNAEIIVVRDD